MAKIIIPVYKVQYAIRFRCIKVQDQFTFPYLGDYTNTEVSIHNFNNNTVKIRKKLASPESISPFIVSGIKPDAVNRIEFANLNAFDYPFPASGYFDGFLVIESQQHLDVVVTYNFYGPRKEIIKVEGREGGWS